MVKISLTFSIMFLLVGLLGCQQSNETGSKTVSQELSNSKTGITIKTEEEEYPISVRKINIIMENENNSDFSYGSLPSVEKNIEGIWYKVPYKKDITINAHEPMVYSDSEKKESFPLDILKEELLPGKYRVTITFYKDENQVILAAPFELAK